MPLYNFMKLGSLYGEGNGNPLQYSCLEDSRDGGSWWAAVYGVKQSRTRLSDFHFHSVAFCAPETEVP